MNTGDDQPMRKLKLYHLVEHSRILSTSARSWMSRYCFGATDGASGAGGSAAGVVPLSSDGAAQSPAQILVPFTVPTNLQPIGACGLTWAAGLLATLGGAV